jgi:hypothetical protein
MTTHKNGNRTGLARRLRDYLRDHPNVTALEVAAAIGEHASTVAKTMFKMFQQGFFSAEEMPRVGSRGPSLRYSLLRESRRRSMTVEEAALRRKERQATYRKTENEAKRLKRQAERMAMLEAAPVAVVVVREPETIDAFLARGGRIQVESPCRYVIPPYMPVGFSQGDYA